MFKLRVEELERLTAAFLPTVHQASYEDLEKFVARRGRIVRRIMALCPMNEEEKRLYGQRILKVLQHDTEIRSVIEKRREEARSRLVKIRTAQKQRNVYRNAYTPDSYFFDRRK